MKIPELLAEITVIILIFIGIVSFLKATATTQELRETQHFSAQIGQVRR